MAEYSNTTSSAGYTTSVTLNSETDSYTIVVTAPNGTTATATATYGTFDTAKSSLFEQILPPGTENAQNLYRALSRDFVNTTKNVSKQQDRAAAAAIATNKPVADAPAPPPSTNNQADPAIAPAPNNTPPVENAKPAPTNLAQTAATTNEAIQDKKPTQIDELSAYPPNPIDKKPTEIDELSAYPPNTVAQRSTEIDEDSAYPPNPVDQKPTEIDELSAYPPNTVAQRSTEIDEDSAYPPNPVDVAAKAQLLAGVGRTAPGEALKGLTAQQLNTNSQATQQDTSNFAQKKDWRVKLSLAPGATYLYKNANPGILAPLQATNGVIFPYTPAISVAYNASYDPTDLTHSNYKYFTYRGSAVDSISLGCEFTAQDTTEAAYLLAVIHFFKSVTKMFYGQDKNPIAGTPPPLCYLTGLGTFQFDNHPLVITSFTYTLPVDVDYIQTSGSSPPGVNTAPGQSKGSPNVDPGSSRRDAGGLNTGAVASPPNFTPNTGAASGGASDPTYVPTKMQITIGAVPIVTRADISNTFSLEKYATGELLRGSQRKGGGIW
jgi:hypothetical protein